MQFQIFREYSTALSNLQNVIVIQEYPAAMTVVYVNCADVIYG